MSNKEPYQELRESLTEAPAVLPRPELSKADQIQLAMLARHINSIQDQKVRLAYVAAFVAENARLTMEVNALRVRMGFEAIPTYNPMMKMKR